MNNALEHSNVTDTDSNVTDNVTDTVTDWRQCPVSGFILYWAKKNMETLQ